MADMTCDYKGCGKQATKTLDILGAITIDNKPHKFCDKHYAELAKVERFRDRIEIIA